MTTVNDTSSSSTINDLMNTMNAKPPTAAAADSVEEQTNKFMTLLVTQLKNQDPLNPMDNAQLTTQLAQLSTVTGINKLNDTLSTLQGNYQSTEALAATNLIGKAVLVDGNYAQLKSGQGIFGVDLGSAADSVKVSIIDKNGKEVQVMDLGAQKEGVLPIAWDGVPDPNLKDSSGKPITLPDGDYTLRITATQGGEVLKDAATLTLDSVASVTTSAKDGVKINVPSKGMVTLADIKQVL